MVRLCPICRSEIKLFDDNDLEEEFDCIVCGALFSHPKGTTDLDVFFPGVTCPACFSHDVEGSAHTTSASPQLNQLEKSDFVFRCPTTRKLKEVTFGADGLKATLV